MQYYIEEHEEMSQNEGDRDSMKGKRGNLGMEGKKRDVPEWLWTLIQLCIAQRTPSKASSVSLALSVSNVVAFVRMGRHTEAAVVRAQMVLHNVWVLRYIDLL